MKVIIVRCGALGDLVYATSVIDALILQYGDSVQIDFVCTPGSAQLFKNDPRVNQVFHLKHKKVPIFFSVEKRKIITYSKQNIYDLLINFEYGSQFTDLLENIDAKEKIGAQFEDILIDKKINRGEAQKLFLQSKISQENLAKAYPKVHTLEDDEIMSKFNLNQNYLVLSPSNSHVNRSGLNHRAWENDSWTKLIQKLSNEIQIVIVGAKNEQTFFERLRPFSSNTIDLVGKNSIEELSSIIKFAQGVICTDSAVGHIAAALNTPVFVLMGPNDIITDSPYQTPHNKVYPISLEIECSPCYNTKIMKACKENICMKNISSELVYNRVKSAIVW
ncbi:glycosyltransferase family 9 protein [Sulfurimonas sp.]|uniref:glycosyltransferase family 9 protein n=1 Tax=Sulfurimonas sp. TaxID=2022749 RepID=UPI003D1135F4